MENNNHEHPTHFLDPVCGMEIDSDSVEHVSVYEGQEYFFCSPRAQLGELPSSYSERS